LVSAAARITVDMVAVAGSPMSSDQLSRHYGQDPHEGATP
jgi:hypothetical protein